MNSHWFKFYGQDWLTDLKIIMLSPVDRLCFITLLCLASTTDDAIIKNCDENALIELTHLYDNPYDDEDNDRNRAKGCLSRFNDNAMITIDNASNITITNFLKRQGSNLTDYERVKKHREKQKNKLKKDTNVINDNTMITLDKIREDKIRGDNNNNSEQSSPTLQKLIEPFKTKYDESLINDFLLYWTEKNPNGKKERWQMQKVFDVERRLITWSSKDWNKKKPLYESITL